MDPRTCRVVEIMQTDVATLAPNECLDLADDVMRLGGIRHLPVIDDIRLVGLVSSRDLLAASLTKSLEFDPLAHRSFMRVIKVSDVMSSDVITVGPDATLSEAAALLLKHKIGCLPVVEDDDVLIGLVTETDLLKVAFLREDLPFSVEVKVPPRGVRATVGALMREIRDGYGRIGEMF